MSTPAQLPENPQGRSEPVAGRAIQRVHLGDLGRRPFGTFREYAEVTGAIAVVTLAAWYIPTNYRVFGDVYLLAVIMLCLRVGRWPIFYAAVLSALAWNYFIVPPKMSFSTVDLKDGLFLGTYFVVALIAGQLVARIRSQQRREREREQRATALLHLTEAMSAAGTLDEGVEAALRQADGIFGARTALLLPDEAGRIQPHRASSLAMDADMRREAMEEWNRDLAERKRPDRSILVDGLHLVMGRAGTKLGVLSLGWDETVRIAPRRRELIEAFAAQIALLVEREQLRAASAREKLLEESERLHRTLFDSVSHELKTPLAVLRTASESASWDQDERRATLLGEMRTATQRLDRLVGNLLNQTRLESGVLKPILDWCDARDLIGAAKRAAGEGVAERTTKVVVPEEMPLFMADALLMEQALANLLVNAAQHAGADERITVTCGFDESGGRVFISVMDNGPGIAPELLDRIFQKFQRGANARAGGLGLGLSIVRGFMQAQGGDVTAENNPGGGARFTLYLPHKVHETVPHE